MKCWFLVLPCLVITFFAATLVHAAAGTESSGGTEFYQPTGAWFKSLNADRKIRTCVLISDDFGVERQGSDGAQATLQLAFKKWGDYLLEKRIQKFPVNNINDGYFFNTELEMLDTCGAGEQTEDLRVYLGFKDEQVLAAKSKFTKPYGFVSLSSNSSSHHKWQQGFIYIATPSEIAPAPAWSKGGDHLLGILLHEVGHILGNGHLDGTIMESNLGEWLGYAQSFRQFSHIDGARELRICVACAAKYEGLIADQSAYSAEHGFEALVGKKPAQLSQAVFFKKEKENPDGSHGEDYNLPEGELVYSDLSGDTSFTLKSESVIASNAIDVPIFGGWRSYGETFIGTLSSKEGRIFPVVINLNSNGAAFEIQLMDHQHYPQVLFWSSWASK